MVGRSEDIVPGTVHSGRELARFKFRKWVKRSHNVRDTPKRNKDTQKNTYLRHVAEFFATGTSPAQRSEDDPQESESEL